MAAQQSHDSFPSSSIPANFEVFLSFRGADTRKNFTDHLYHALVQAGVRTFRDDEELEKGESIKKSLPKAIQESKISIPVFSRNYASSKWCLDELVEIMECKEEIGQKVLPIFLDDASPSDVRKQTGSFAKAFEEHEMRFAKERVDKWREALRAAGELSGYNLNEIANGHESELIKKVVAEVLKELGNTPLDIGRHLVGIDSRVKCMTDLLNIESNKVRIVGISGIGGIGKTTIAKAVYNQISGIYKGSSFLESVREVSQQPNGLVCLQKQLFLDIMRYKSSFISNVSTGTQELKKRFYSKKILVILDDVDQEDQFYSLVGGRDCFCPGSRIIIITRNERLLTLLEVDAIHKPKVLDDDESLQLFSKHAFRRDKPLEEYMELSMNVTRTAGGLPLTLKVLGSYLFNRMPTYYWEQLLEKLKKTLPGQVQKILKISYGGLDMQQRDIFLDIACFFRGMDMQDAIDIFKACGFLAQLEIQELIDRSLVEIVHNKLIMHDQIRDMGRQIVYEESPEEPGERSRLWDYEEVLDVLNSRSGTAKVKGLILNFDETKQIGVNLGPLLAEAFAGMTKLRLLRVNNAHIVGNFACLSKELRWLCWHRCPLKSISTSLHLGKLVIFDLSHSHSLTKTPDFSGLPRLERLILEGCTGLVLVHKSIGDLRRLVFLNLKDCNNLVDLPDSICMLDSLESLVLSNCLKISSLPGNLGNMKSLTELLLDNTAVEQLPGSIGLLNNLRRLDLGKFSLGRGKSWSRIPGPPNRLEFSLNIALGRIPGLGLINSLGSLLKLGFSQMWRLRFLPNDLDSQIIKLPTSFSGLYSLQELNLSYCNLSEGAIPSDFGRLSSLKYLYLQGNNFCSLPNSIGGLSRLEHLQLSDCKKLQTLPEDIGSLSSLGWLDLYGCNNFCSLPNIIFDLSRLENLRLTNCTKLQTLPEDIGSLSSLRWLYLEGCNNLCSLPNRISGLSRLEHLLLSNCTKLQTLPGDIGSLSSLRSLSLTGCNNICSLPASISNLSRLEELFLSYCTNLQSLPEDIGRLSSLKLLHLDRCKNLCCLPTSISDLSRLKSLWLSYCRKLQALPATIAGLSQLKGLTLQHCTKLLSLPEDIGGLSSLESLNLGYNNFCSLPDSFTGLSRLHWLNLSHCVKLQALPEDFGRLSSLKRLDLSGNNLCSLPASICGLSQLGELNLSYCTKLQSLPEFTSRLQKDANHCISIESSANRSNLDKLTDLFIIGCENLADIPGLERLTSLELLEAWGCSTLANNMRRKGLVQGIAEHLKNLRLPGSEVPEWFSHPNTLSCEVPALYGREIQGITLCFVIVPNEEGPPCISNVGIRVHIKRNNIEFPNFVGLLNSHRSSHVGGTLFYHITDDRLGTNLEEGDQIHASISTATIHGLQVIKTGIHLVYNPMQCFEPITQDITTLPARRGRHDDEAGPSSGWSNEERTSKRLRRVYGTPMDLDLEQE